MKKYLLFFVSLFLLSCNNKQHDLIKDFEQTVDGVKTDMSMKILQLDNVGVLTYKDSLLFYCDNPLECELDSIITSINYTESYIADFKNKGLLYKDSLEKELNKKTPISYEIEYYRSLYELYSKEDALTSHLEYLALLYKIKTYAESPETAIGNIWYCKYSIINPFLNNAKQEISKKYLFNSDNSKIISIFNDKKVAN